MALLVGRGRADCTAAPVIDEVPDTNLLHITCPDCPLDYFVTSM